MHQPSPTAHTFVNPPNIPSGSNTDSMYASMIVLLRRFSDSFRRICKEASTAVLLLHLVYFFHSVATRATLQFNIPYGTITQRVICQIVTENLNTVNWTIC